MNWQEKIVETMVNIRNQPNNPDFRVELIQFLCMTAEWERALKQLEQFQKVFPEQDKILTLYLFNQIESELRRSKVFQADFKPLSFEFEAGSELILKKQLSILAAIQENKHQTVVELHTQLAEVVSSIDCDVYYVDDKNRKSKHIHSEQWIMDGDARTTFVCELFLRGNYYWQPWHTFASIEFLNPKSLLDIIWRQANIQLRNGMKLQAIVPSRYVSFPNVQEDELNFCSKTLWKPLGIGNYFVGTGQKILYGAENSEYPVLDLEALVFS